MLYDKTNIPSGVIHGGIDYTWAGEENIDPDDILDFSVCVNPCPQPPEVIDALKHAAIGRYPDSTCGELTRKIADVCGVNIENILVTNGTSQGIFLTALALLDRSKETLVCAPCYGEYEAVSSLYSAGVIKTVDQIFDHRTARDSNAIITLVHDRKPSALWLCNPNNPTGQYLGDNAINNIRSACEKAGTHLILDEAYVQFLNDPGLKERSRKHLENSHTVVLRSMTKDYGIPGLRVGYIIADPPLIRFLQRLQPAWSVGAPAQGAALAALERNDYFIESIRLLRSHTYRFQEELKASGLDVFETDTTFFLARHPRIPAIIDFLKSQCILVRDCTSFGLPGFIRIGTRLECGNERLAREIEGFLKAE